MSIDDEIVNKYLIGIEKGDADAMYNLGYYYKQMEDYNNMLKYFLMAVDKNHVEAMFQLGNYYYYYGKNDSLMIKYYSMAGNKGHHIALFRLGEHYDSNLSKFNANTYYSMAVACGSSEARLKLQISDFEYYYLLSKIQNKSTYIIEQLQKLEQNTKIFCFKNKINLLGKEAICIKCSDLGLCIPKECAHFFCIDCYPKTSWCSTCKIYVD